MNQKTKKKKTKTQRGRRPDLVFQLRKHPDKFKNPVIYFRLLLAEYLLGKEGEILTNKEKQTRKKALVKKLKRSEQTLKAMYRSGQGSLKHWLIVIEHISKIVPQSLIDIIRMFPYFKEGLENLSPTKKRILEKLEQTNSAEDELIDALLEVGLEKNRLAKIGNHALGVKKK